MPLPNTGILTLAQGLLANSQPMVKTPDDKLCVHDILADGSHVARRLTSSGVQLSSVPIPADTMSCLMDSSGRVYAIANNTSTVTVVSSSNTSETKPLPGLHLESNIGLVTIGGEECLLLMAAPRLGDGKNYRIRLSDWAVTELHFSEMPPGVATSNARCREIQVLPNGDIYVLSVIEGRVWRYNSSGQLLAKLGGGGPTPPQDGLPGETMGDKVAVAPNGDLYWSRGSYGQMERLPVSGLASEWSGIERTNVEGYPVPWLSGVEIQGAVVIGDRFFVLGDRFDRAILSIPLATVDAGQPDVRAVEPGLFGYAFSVQADVPWKLFTSPQVELRAQFKGFRNGAAKYLRYELRDVDERVIFSGLISLANLPREGDCALPLPSWILPKLGRYRLFTEIAFSPDGPGVIQRLTYITRGEEDSRLPIPPVENLDMNNARLHAMCGAGLQRFSGHIAMLCSPNTVAEVALARSLGTRVMLQIEPKDECNPASIRLLHATYPDIELVEVMNESVFQGVGPVDYVNLHLRPCYQEAKRLGWGAKIIGMAHVEIGLGWYQAALQAGLLDCCDVISFHAYEGNNTIDAGHQRFKVRALRALIDSFGGQSKPLMMTEYGTPSNFATQFVRERWHGWQHLLHLVTLQQVGIDFLDFCHFYWARHGFDGYPSWSVDSNAELYLSAALARVYSQMLFRRAFAGALVFDAHHAYRLIGNRHNATSPGGQDVLLVMNTGAGEPVRLGIDLPVGGRVLDAFRNVLSTTPGRQVLAVGHLPVYIEVPHGAPMPLQTDALGSNVLVGAALSVNDPAAQANLEKLRDGMTDREHMNRMEQECVCGTRGRSPLEIVARFATPHELAGTVVVGGYGDNESNAITKARILVEPAQAPGTWVEVARIDQAATSQSLALPDSNNKRYTPYLGEHHWFRHWEPRRCLASKLVIEETTPGQYVGDLFTEVFRDTFHGDVVTYAPHGQAREWVLLDQVQLLDGPVIEPPPPKLPPKLPRMGPGQARIRFILGTVLAGPGDPTLESNELPLSARIRQRRGAQTRETTVETN